jgi:hypothetical protein
MNEISIIKLDAEIENEELKVEQFIGIRFISNRFFYLFK